MKQEIQKMMRERVGRLPGDRVCYQQRERRCGTEQVHFGVVAPIRLGENRAQVLRSPGLYAMVRREGPCVNQHGAARTIPIRSENEKDEK